MRMRPAREVLHARPQHDPLEVVLRDELLLLVGDVRRREGLDGSRGIADRRLRSEQDLFHPRGGGVHKTLDGAGPQQVRVMSDN